MKIIVYILQNAWRYNIEPGTRWDDSTWRRLMWRSQTGKRLREYIPDGTKVYVINATPIATNNGKEIIPPDLMYVEKKLKEYKPDLVILLGKVAHTLSDKLSQYTHLCYPHPCYRALSKKDTFKYLKEITKAIS